MGEARLGSERGFGAGWLGYEARGLGRIGLLTPVFVAAAFALFAIPTYFFGADRGRVAGLLSSVPEVYLPMAAGLVAATVVAREPAVDLHLTLKTAYRTTVARRVALIVAGAAVASSVWALALRAFGLWTWPGGFPVSQLGWVAPLLWFVSSAVFLTLMLKSSIAAGAMLGGWWLFQHLLGGVFFMFGWLRPFYLFPMSSHRAEIEQVWGEGYWADGWPVLLAMALLMALGAALMLGSGGRLVGGGEA